MNKFRTQILGMLSLLIALTVFLLIGLSYSAFRQESITLNTQILQTKNDTVKNEINRQIDVYRGMLAGLNITRADFQNGKLTAQAYSQLELLFNQFGTVANGTFLFSKDGDIWGRNGDPLDINVKAASRDYYLGIFQQNQSFYMSSPYVSSTTGEKVVGMSYRLNNDLAVLATINLDALLDSIYHRDDMFFFTSDGTILFSPYPELLEKNIFQIRPYYKNFSSAKPYINYQADVDGQSVAFTAFWSNIDANNWQFVTFIRDKSINQNANAQLISSIIIAGISLLIVTGILWLVIQRLILTPVGGAPAEIASPMEKMAQGDLAQNLTQTGKETGIYASLINLTEQLSKLIKGSLGISESVSSASMELTTVMGETLKNAQDELEQVELISTGIE